MPNLQALLDAATPRPWPPGKVLESQFGESTRISGRECIANRDLSEHAVNHFEALVGALEELVFFYGIEHNGFTPDKARAVLAAAKMEGK